MPPRTPAGRHPLAASRLKRGFAISMIAASAGLCGSRHATANNPGGTTGSGANVTVVNNGDGTVTMANGIVSIIINTADSRIGTLNYTYNNNGTTQTTSVIQPNSTGRENYYYGGFFLGDGTYTYTLATDPASNGGNYADVELLSVSSDDGILESHFSMLRGSPGFYTTAINTHRNGDAAFGFGAFGLNSRVTSVFNWTSNDAARNYFIGTQPDTYTPTVPTASHEMVINLDGSLAGQYDDKFFTGQDRSGEQAWGWSSVGPGGLNIGVWTTTNMDFGDGGPLKRDVGAYPGNLLVNNFLTNEVGQGSDGTLAANEVWTKTTGPWFVYLNNVSSSITDPNQAAQALFNDATAQAAAEHSAWPYSWFINPAYPQASGRGTVTGQLVIDDASGNRNPPVQGTWVGLVQQPTTSTGTYDFQKWLKPYQYFAQTDSGGNFTIPNVIADSLSNYSGTYTLYAYGPGIAGTFMSQPTTGGLPPLELDMASPAVAVTVTAGQTTALGAITWNAHRIGATVFELGVPDRTAGEFRHGEDYWAPQMAPKLGYPTGVWGGEMYYPIEFPNGVTYTAGTSRWTTDWNYVLPTLQNPAGVYQPSSGTINFNLASNPVANAQASIYLGGAGDQGGNIIISVNGTNLGTVTSGVTAAPNALSSTGFNPPSGYTDDSSVHCSDHGPFFDERINFPGSLLHAGANTITVNNDSTGSEDYLMVDYLRLELTSYVPPPPASVVAYPGNNRNLVTWPLVPGATRYAILRATSPTGTYTTLADGYLGTVSGSGPSSMTYTDTTAVNNTNYYYEIESLNPTGNSAPSVNSGRATPSSTFPTSAPAAPTGLATNGVSSHSVALKWDSGSDASYCNVYRTTMHPNGVGGTYPLRTILVQDINHGDADTYTFTDTTPTDGTTYSYYVEAVNAYGTSGSSATVTATSLPSAPGSAPASLSATRMTSGTSVALSWSPVTGASGYAIYRSTTSGGPFAFPANFVNGTGLASYTDSGLSASTTYYYQVTAVNVGGTSGAASVTSAP